MRLILGMVCASLALAFCAEGYAAITYSGGIYTQDFNGLPMTGAVTKTGRGPLPINGELGTVNLAEWTMSNYGGSSTDTEFRAQDGSLSGSAGRGVVSFGAANSTDRALGALATSNQISRFGVSFTNNTGSTISGFNLAYTGEQWRRGDPDTHNNISFAYSLTATDINSADVEFTVVPALSFNSPNVAATPNNVALDGNAAGNSVAVGGSVGLNWTPGSTLTLRWSGFDISGQDDGLSIDDLSFRGVPEPATALMALCGVFATLGLRRRRK